MAFMTKGGKANDSKTAPKNLPADDARPDPSGPAEPAEIKAGESEPANDPFSGFKLKEKVVIASLNNAVGTIMQLTNHAGKPVAEVKLPNGSKDWFELKQIAAVPADAVPSGGIPTKDPSMPPAQAATPDPQLSA